MKENWFDSDRDVVHLSAQSPCGELTLCGFAFDEPASERGGELMIETDEPCTCQDCIEQARFLLPYLKREIRRVGKHDVHAQSRN